MDRYQLARADGHPDWGIGRATFERMWDRAYDLLRFHRGAGFTIAARPAEPGPERTLEEVKGRLRQRMSKEASGTIFEVASQKDHYRLLFRRDHVDLDKGQLVLAEARSLIGTPYIFGVTDCSWLTLHCYAEQGVSLPHNAHAQHLDPQVIAIPRAKIEPGDLVFIDDDNHVALWLDAEGGGRVIDTEPHDAPAPPGWPTRTLGTGVRVRPAFGNYYCARIDGIGRVSAINGEP